MYSSLIKKIYNAISKEAKKEKRDEDVRAFLSQDGDDMYMTHGIYSFAKFLCDEDNHINSQGLSSMEIIHDYVLGDSYLSSSVTKLNHQKDVDTYARLVKKAVKTSKGIVSLDSRGNPKFSNLKENIRLINKTCKPMTIYIATKYIKLPPKEFKKVVSEIVDSLVDDFREINVHRIK